MRGYRTEGAPWTFPKGQYPQFRNLTLEDGTIRPRGSDEAYVPPGTGFSPFLYANLGIKSMVELDFGVAVRLVHCPLAGGAPTVRTSAGAEETLTIAAPDSAPQAEDGGSGEGHGIKFTASSIWIELVAGDYEVTAGAFIPGALIKATADADAALTRISNPQPSVHTAGPNTPKKLDEGYKGGTYASTDWIIPGGVFAAGFERTYAARWTTPLGGRSALGPPATYAIIEDDKNFLVELPGAVPAGVTGWELFALDSGGTYRLVGSAATGGSIIDATSDAELIDLDAFDGPVDADALPETLQHLTSGTLVCEHNGSLFVADGRYLYPSERFEYRYFLSRLRIDCRDTIVGLAHRSDHLEVYTTRTVYVLVGDHPNYTLRDLATAAGAAAWNCVASSSHASFAYVHDVQTPTVYRLNAKGWFPLTRNVHTPWLKAHALTAAGVILGCSESALWIVSKTAVGGVYPALCYDWATEEWWEASLAALPLGFRYESADRVLTSRTAVGVYVKHGTGAAAVAWALELKPDQFARYEDSPVWLLFDADGAFSLEFLADGVSQAVLEVPLGGEREVVLPEASGKAFRYVVTGTGAAETSIRGVDRG